MNSRLRRCSALLIAVLLVAFSTPAAAAPSCPLVLRPPVPGVVVRPFEPMRTGGHFGVDLAAPRAKWPGCGR